MKKLKVFKELSKTLDISTVGDKNEREKLASSFERLKKELNIEKDISILDLLHLKPFKLEYVSFRSGIKDYFVGLDKQREKQKDKYVNLVLKKDSNLIQIKSFGKVSNLDDTTFEMLILLMRISQYYRKSAELYSLKIHIMELTKL